MRWITIDDVVKATGGKLVGEYTGAMIKGVARDTRDIKDGYLFVAFKGARADGHDFIKGLFENNGLAAALCEYVPEGVTGPCIVVDSTMKALQDLAEWYRLTLDAKVVGISGSVGKTSSKEMLASVLSEKYKVHKTPANLNNEIGLPLTVLATEEDDEIVVLEMGISDFGEMQVLAKVGKPDVCVLTNIGESHLEALGTRDGILKAKTEMFEYRNPEGPIFLNGDDDKLSTIKDVNGTKPVFFGFAKTNYSYPENVEFNGLAGTSMTINLGMRKIPATITMIGKPMVANACMAASVAEYFDMTPEEIARGLKKATTIDGRCMLYPFGDGFVINDAYNAAPLSMKAGIETLCMAPGVRVAVLGDMLELGNDTKKMHADTARFAVSQDIDTIIFVGELGKVMYEAALAEKKDIRLFYYDTVEICADNIMSIVKPGDVVYLKASHGMNFDLLVRSLLN